MTPLHSFRTTRWVRTLNLVLQAILFLTFCFGLNYLARDHAWRYDLTKHRRYSLSPETLSWVQQLRQPVRIVATLSEDNDSPEVRGLLNEYFHASENNPIGKITVEYLDVYQNRGETEKLGIDQADLLVLLCGDKRRALTLNELYRMDKGTRVAFQGEQALTAALLDVSSPEKKKIYFLVGHGELRPEDVDPARGLSILREQLRIRNFDVDAVDLGVTRQIPADASVLVSVAPQGKFTSREQELIRQYLSANAGRAIFFLPPGPPSFGLDDLMLDWGVLVDDDVICDIGPNNVTEDNELIIGAYAPDHPVTQTLLSYKMFLHLGPTRSVRAAPGLAAGSGLNTMVLAATSKTAWGEVSYRNRGIPQYNPGVDIKAVRGMNPPDMLGVIVASERSPVRQGLPFSVPHGRIVVFGNGDLASNGRIASTGNLDVFLGAVNWTVDRDTQLNIPARPIERFQLSLSASDAVKLRYSLLLALPGAAAILGLLVYWTRRS